MGSKYGIRQIFKLNEPQFRSRDFQREKKFRKGTCRGKLNTAYIYRTPHDEAGNYLKCFVCESIMHFKRDCPHRKRNQKASAFEISEVQVNAEVSEAHKIGTLSCEGEAGLHECNSQSCSSG